MLLRKEEIIEFVKTFYYAYLIEKSHKKLLKMLSPNILWSGIYSREIYVHIDQVKIMLENIDDFHYQPFTILYENYTIEEVDDDFIQVAAVMNIRNDSEARVYPLHSSLLCKYENGEWNIHQVHFSLFVDKKLVDDCFKWNLSGGKDFIQKSEAADRDKQLQKDNNNLKIWTNNVPGGIFRCLYDKKLTLLQMSEGFMDLIGYTRQEIKEVFDDSFLAIIDPRDQESTLEAVGRQITLGTLNPLEFRVVNKNGNSLWLIDKWQLLDEEDGFQSFYSVLIDISHEKQREEELRLSLEKHKMIMDQTNDIIFEWNISDDKLTVSANWEKKFGSRMEIENLNDIFNKDVSNLFYKEDQILVQELIDGILAGKHYAQTELRINNKKEYIWCRIRVTTQFDDNHVPIKAIGVIIDIDREKRASETLLIKAEQDALTAMYNKITSQTMIAEYLKHCARDEKCALLIIDIDNFKNINDRLGHLYGDAVLSDISNEIKKMFRTEDIIGRIGGDEFIVFMKSIDNVESVLKAASRVIYNIAHLSKQIERHCTVSCSIGISMFDTDGKTLPELYQKADNALYKAKSDGKNCYVLYDKNCMGELLLKKNTVLRSVISDKIDSDENSKILNGKLVEYVFRILYKSIDINTAVHLILEIVGIQFDVSRVYIFENIENDEYCRNTFEWCNSGVERQINTLQHISYEDDLAGSYMNNFNQDGIFYCRDIKDLPQAQYEVLSPQGIKSMLQCAISDNGVFRGYVGFDECRQNRYWTQEQVDALVFISEILSTFLLKNRVEEQLRQESEGMREVLNNQNSWIYVIDPVTYELLFLNKKTKIIAPEAKIGMACYKCFLNRSTPCMSCPAQEIMNGSDNNTVEFYNPVLDVWSNADASSIIWKGKKSILLCCHDITKFKRV